MLRRSRGQELSSQIGLSGPDDKLAGIVTKKKPPAKSAAPKKPSPAQNLLEPPPVRGKSGTKIANLGRRRPSTPVPVVSSPEPRPNVPKVLVTKNTSEGDLDAVAPRSAKATTLEELNAQLRREGIDSADTRVKTERNFANASQEVLIHGYVNSDAIICSWIWPMFKERLPEDYLDTSFSASVHGEPQPFRDYTWNLAAALNKSFPGERVTMGPAVGLAIWLLQEKIEQPTAEQERRGEDTN